MKLVRTTISINTILYSKLIMLNSQQRRKLIDSAIKKAILANRGTYFKRTVQYQNLNRNLKRIHCSLPVDLYEILTDIRNFGKQSISKILGEILTQLLTQIKEINISFQDTFSTMSYHFTCNKTGSYNLVSIVWTIALSGT